MYSTLPTFVLGFHGCDSIVGEAILDGTEMIRPSANDWDWLGHGSYFWENNPTRAREYAEYSKANPRTFRGKITDPFVIGAIIDLGYCLNLLDSKALQKVKAGHEMLVELLATNGIAPPKNREVAGEKLVRPLDCAVIETVHRYNADMHERQYDTVRGVFLEGAPLYEGTEFRERNHIQVCVRNPNSIKGFFRVRESDAKYAVP